ncbi:MAG: hypothetical protein V4692_02980 [Bdellovibrionota bacterium]
MRAASVIILTSSKALALKWSIDDVIQKILDEKRVPILVLGPDADELLSAASKIERCEIVFDPNFTGNEFSGVKAGLHATGQPAFVWNGDGDFPSAHSRLDLERALLDTKHDVLLIEGQDTQTMITRGGLMHLRTLDSSTQWRTSSLIRFHALSPNDSAAPTSPA